MADGTQSKCRAVCLISGSGTNLQAIIGLLGHSLDYDRECEAQRGGVEDSHDHFEGLLRAKQV